MLDKDAIINDIRSRRNESLRMSVNSGEEIQESRAARVKETASRIGVPEEVADRNLEKLSHIEGVYSKNQEQIEKSPALKKWLNNRYNAALAKDDIDPLSRIESMLGSFTQGAAGIPSGTMRGVAIQHCKRAGNTLKILDRGSDLTIH